MLNTRCHLLMPPRVDLRRRLWYAQRLYWPQRSLVPCHLHRCLCRCRRHRRISVRQYSDIRTYLMARVARTVLHSNFE
jgi:hypothetical protein